MPLRIAIPGSLGKWKVLGSWSNSRLRLDVTQGDSRWAMSVLERVLGPETVLRYVVRCTVY